MNLGLFLASGESLSELSQKGQLKRLVNYNIKKYSEAFKKVYVFTYKDEKIELPSNCILVPNKTVLHRYLYGPLIPVIHFKELLDCDILRGLQITGGIPCILSKLLIRKKSVINYGYDYKKFAKIEGKIVQSIFFPLLTRTVSFFVDKIIVTSIDLYSDLRFVPKKKLFFNNSAGVDLKLFGKKQLYKKTNNFKLLFIGRLEPQKNLKNLIEAVCKIEKKINLIFIGSGSLKENLKGYAQKLGVNLKIKESVDYLQIPKFLERTDIFVLPSFIEGNPKVLIEAMASGVPVIGTNVKGINHIIVDKKNGLLCNTDPESIKSAIMALFDYELRLKLSQNAYKYVAKNYEINKLLDREINILKKIAKND